MRRVMYGVCRWTLKIAMLSLSLFAYTLSYANYEIGSSIIINDVIKKSREIKSLQYVLESNKILLDAENKYYYPKVKVTAEHSTFDGQKVDPLLEKDSELILGVTSLFYSDMTRDRVLASDNKVSSSYYQLIGRKNIIYYNVMEQLIKIERNREFLRESEWVKNRLNEYMLQLEGSVEAGIYPKSYLRESQIVNVRFQSVIDAAKSNIDRYFTDLSLKTGYKVIDKNKIGISNANIYIVMNYEPSFAAEEAVKRNLGLMSRHHEVESLKYLANTQDERVRVSFFSDVLGGLIETNRNQFLNVRETSVAGVRVEVDVFDIRKTKTKNAFYKNYLAEREILDEEMERLMVQIQELKDAFETAKNKRENLISQMALGESLLEDQENEILIDRIQFIDIIKSLSEIIQTRVENLENDINIIETVFNYQRIVGSVFVED